MIAKNPCLHPGDVRIAKCVDRPELHYLKDVLVFSQKGSRPLQNMCSGSDLDGDIYLISWDKSLMPSKLYEPDSYVSDNFLHKQIVSMNDIINFYIRYMKSNHLGVIANAHLAISDRKSILSEDALRLAQLFNKCVDFPKTGYLSRVSETLIPEKYPDFMEAKHNSYKSEKILGRLYRRSLCMTIGEIPNCECERCIEKHLLTFNKATKILVRGSPVIARYVDYSMLKEMPPNARGVYARYKDDLRAFMSANNFKTEEEAFLGFCEDGDRTIAFSSELSKIINKYRNLEASEMNLLWWYKESHECNQSINSFPWIFPNSDIIGRMVRFKVLFSDEEYGNFIFNRKILLNEKPLMNDENDKSSCVKSCGQDMELLCKILNSDYVDYKEAIYCNFLKIYCDMNKNKSFEKQIPQNLKLFFSEVFNMLFAAGFFTISNFDVVFDFFIYLTTKISGISKYSVATALMEISSKMINLQKKHKNAEDYSNLLMNVAYLLCVDIEVSYKISSIISSIKRKESNLIGKTRKVTKKLRSVEVIMVGMFDANDEIRLEKYNGPHCMRHEIQILYRPELLNIGHCTVENYKDICFHFIQGIFNYECFKKHKNVEFKRKSFITTITPGYFYFQDVNDQKYINNVMTIDSICNVIFSTRKETLKGLFPFVFNNHPLLNEKTRGESVEELGLMFGEKVKKYTLTLIYKENRYTITLEEKEGVLVPTLITKDRKVVGKMYLLGILNSKTPNDCYIELISENIIYDKDTNCLNDFEKKLLTKNLVLIIDEENDKIKLNAVVSGYDKARMEIDYGISESVGYPIKLSHRRVYTSEKYNRFKGQQNKLMVYSRQEIIGSRLVNVDDFEDYFEKIWGAIVAYYS